MQHGPSSGWTTADGRILTAGYAQVVGFQFAGMLTTPFGTAIAGGRGGALLRGGRSVMAGITANGVDGSHDSQRRATTATRLHFRTIC